MAEWLVSENHDFCAVGSSPRRRRIFTNSSLIFTFSFWTFRTLELLFVVFSLVLAKPSCASELKIC